MPPTPHNGFIDSNQSNSGARTIFSSNTVPNGTNPLSDPQGLVEDTDNSILLVDRGQFQLLRVDKTNGARSLVANFTNANTVEGVAVGSSGIFVTKTNATDQVLKVNPNTGVFTVVGSNAIGDGVLFGSTSATGQNVGFNIGIAMAPFATVAPDLTVSIVSQGGPFQQGGTVTYTITVTNSGNGPTSGTITVQDVIPTGLTVTSASGTNWTSTLGPTVTCTSTTPLAAGASTVITLIANIAANAPLSITNTVSVQASGESNTGNNSGSATINVNPIAPDLTVSIVAQGGPFQQGGTVTYTITVTNSGNGPTSGTITVQDVIPTGLTVTSASGTNWTSTLGPTVTCTSTTPLAAGASTVITLIANIAANAPSSITNTVSVQASGESNTGNNSGSSIINVNPIAPDLTVSIVAQGGPFQQGGTVTYTITVTNSGNGPTSGTITVQDVIPTGLTVTSASGTNWTSTLGPTVTCTSTTPLAAGASTVITLIANIAANAPSSITNTVSVQTSGESNTGNNSGSSIINVNPIAPDLTVSIVAQGGPFQQGGTVTYTITVTNSGNGPTSGTITVQDVIPTGLTVTSASGTNWTSTLGPTVTCTSTTPLAAGASTVITLIANIAANAPSSITNTVSVQASGESNTGNNSGSSIISVNQVAPDLTVSIVAQGGPFQQGGTVTYTITVTNSGNGPTSGTITVQDVIPTGLTVTSASGTNWTSTLGPIVTCTSTTPLAAGASTVITLIANIAANAPSSITNTVSVQTSGESNTGNNSGSSIISVNQVAPDLTVSIVAQGGPFQQGGTVTYTITVTNSGNGPTSGTITVQDVIPTGLTATSASGTNWTSTLGPIVTCTSTTPLAAGASTVITLIANIAANAPSSITNTVSVQTSGESNTGNNSGSATIAVTPPLNLVFDLSGNLVFTSPNGRSDNIMVEVSGPNYVISDVSVANVFVFPSTATGNGTNSISIPIVSVTGKLIFNTGDASDALEVSFAGGNPANEIVFNGGESLNDDDKLRISKYNVPSLTVNHSGPESGDLVVGGSKINFSQIEPLALAGSAADLVINLPAGPNTDIVLADDTNANFPGFGLSVGNTTAIDASTFEYTSFTNPTNSLLIKLGDNGDTLTVNTLDAGFSGFNASLTIDGGTGDDVVKLNSDNTFAPGKILDVDLQNDTVVPGIDSVRIGLNANLITSGSGTITIKASKDISMEFGSSLETTDGGVTLEANQQAVPTSGLFFTGININGGLVESTGKGVVTVKGRGGDDPIGIEHGVAVYGGGDIIGGTTA